MDKSSVPGVSGPPANEVGRFDAQSQSQPNVADRSIHSKNDARHVLSSDPSKNQQFSGGNNSQEDVKMQKTKSQKS